MARPTTLLKVLSLVLAAFLATVIGIGLWVSSLRDRKWADLETRVAELTPNLEPPPLPRVPLGRTLVPGNAWDDYLRFASPAFPRDLPDSLDDLLAKANREEKQSLIDLNVATIELLRRAVRRQTATAPAPGKPPGKNNISGYRDIPVKEVVSLCIARAQLAADSGHPREALDLLLDVFLCGRDFATARLMKVPYWGLKPMERSLREIEQLSGKLDPSMLPDLERQLSLLDEYFPDTSGEILDHLLHLGELLVQEDEDDQVFLQFSPDRTRRHWRYFYSTRLEAASTFAAGDSLVRQALALKDQSWAVAEPELWALENRREALQDPVLSYFLERNLDTFVARNTRTYLRMVRIAVHYRATGTIQAMNNDQGGPIGTKLSEDSLLIWNERPPKQEGVQPPSSQTYVESFLIEVPIRK